MRHATAAPVPALATISMGQSSPSVRLNVVKDMLRRARTIIDRLDTPQPRHAQTERQQQATASTSPQSATNTPTRGHLGRASFRPTSTGGSVPDVRVMATSAAAGAFPPGLAQAISGIVQNVIDGSVAHGQPGQQFEMQVQVQVGFPGSENYCMIVHICIRGLIELKV